MIHHEGLFFFDSPVCFKQTFLLGFVLFFLIQSHMLPFYPKKTFFKSFLFDGVDFRLDVA